MDLGDGLGHRNQGHTAAECRRGAGPVTLAGRVRKLPTTLRTRSRRNAFSEGVHRHHATNGEGLDAIAQANPAPPGEESSRVMP